MFAISGSFLLLIFLLAAGPVAAALYLLVALGRRRS